MTAADAAARAHGEPVTILTMDWNSLMEKIRVTFGPDICDNERLRDVVSEEEAQDQRRQKADPAGQYMHLDGKLPLQTRRKFTSEEPANQEQLRAKYSVAEHVAPGAAPKARKVDLPGSHQDHFR